MSAFVAFEWEVPAAGFHWVEMEYKQRRTKEGRFLTAEHIGPALAEKWPAGAKGGGRRYLPLSEYPALFRTFAATSRTEAGILAFANRYGALNTAKDAITPHLKERASLGTDPVGESLWLWTDEIRAMSVAVALWDALKSGDEAALAQLVRWQDTQHLTFKRDGRWVAAPDFHPDARTDLVPGELRVPALFYVQHEINRQVQRNVSPAMLFHSGPNGADLSIFLCPADLASALWFQFAQAVTGNKEYRQCSQCGEWYELHPGLARADKAYCSNACRSKAYRKRLAARKHPEA